MTIILSYFFVCFSHIDALQVKQKLAVIQESGLCIPPPPLGVPLLSLSEEYSTPGGARDTAARPGFTLWSADPPPQWRLGPKTVYGDTRSLCEPLRSLRHRPQYGIQRRSERPPSSQWCCRFRRLSCSAPARHWGGGGGGGTAAGGDGGGGGGGGGGRRTSGGGGGSGGGDTGKLVGSPAAQLH